MSATMNEHQARLMRAQAFMDALYAQRGQLDPDGGYNRLRESYACGSITLGEFEAKVEVLLRSAR